MNYPFSRMELVPTGRTLKKGMNLGRKRIEPLTNRLEHALNIDRTADPDLYFTD